MPYANASARSSGTIGSTVNERRIANLNFVGASLSRNLSRNSSSREVTKLAVADAGSKAPSAIKPSTSARRFDGLCSAGVELALELEVELEIESDIKSAFQILDQQTVSGVDPGDASAAERNCRHRLPRDNRSQRARVGECLLQIVYDITNVVQAAALGSEGVHGRLFIGRFHQFPERIAHVPALQERDANALVGIMKHLLVPIRLQHAGEALHGIWNRSHDEPYVVKRAFGLPG